MPPDSPPERQPDPSPVRPAGERRRARRVSRRRYTVRRVIALAVVAGSAVGAVKVGATLFGSESTDAASPGDTSGGRLLDPAVTEVGGTSTVAETVLGDTTATPTTPITPTATQPAAPTTEAGPKGPPSAGEPAVLLIAGDSDAGTFGPYLETLMSQTGVVQTQLDYKVSSGLSRPDFFDWPAHFRQTVPVVAPDIVVVTFGGNDPQGLSVVEGSTADNPNFIVAQPTGAVGGDVEWRAEYGIRVGAVMDHLSAEGRTLIWVGIPNDDNPDVTARLAVQNEVVQSEAAKRPDVVFVNTWSRFSGRNGNWAEFVIDPRDGLGKDVRAEDGFHLNTTGAEILALDISDAIKVALRARGAAI